MVYFRKLLFDIKKDIKKYQEFFYTLIHLHIYICRCVKPKQLDLTYTLLHQLNSIFRDFFFYFFFMELIIRNVKRYLCPQDVLCSLVAQAHSLKCLSAGLLSSPPSPSLHWHPALLGHQWSLSLAFVKFHVTVDCPMLQSIYIPLQGISSLKRMISLSENSAWIK